MDAAAALRRGLARIGMGETALAVGRATAVQAAGKAAVAVLAAVSIAIVTRYLGPSDYGKLAFALAYLGIFGVIADAGIFTIVVRELSRTPGRAALVAGNALGLRVALGVAAVGVAFLLALALPYEPEVRIAIAIVGASFVIGLANTALVAVFQARLRMEAPVVAETAGRAAALGAVVAVVELDWGLFAVAATAAAGTGVQLAITWVRVRRLVPLRPRADTAEWGRLLRAGIPVGVALAVTEIYFRADTIIIAALLPFEEVGLYSLAFRVLEFTAAFPGVLLASLLPVLSRTAAEGGAEFARALQGATDAMLALAAPVAAGGVLLAPEIAVLAGGEDFRDASGPLRILLAGAGLAFVNGVFGYALIARERQMDALRLTLAALVVNVGLNLALVPSLGIEAAAATTVASEIVVLAGALVLLRRRLGVAPGFAMLARVLPAAALMAAAVWPLREETLALSVPVGAAVYGGAMLILVRR